MPIDWFTVAAQLVNFAVLVWLLKRFLYRPVLDAMTAREAKIRETVAVADRQRAAATEETDRLREQRAALSAQGKDALQKARAEVAAMRDEWLAQAHREAESRQQQLRNALARDWQEFRAELMERVQEEALAIARQALRELADASLEERMAETFLKKLGGLDSGEKARLQAAACSSTRPPILRSSFSLAPLVRAKLQQALRDQLGVHDALQFETRDDLIAGLEIAFDGQKIAWTFDDFLRSIEIGARNLIDQEVRTHAASA